MLTKNILPYRSKASEHPDGTRLLKYSSKPYTAHTLYLIHQMNLDEEFSLHQLVDTTAKTHITKEFELFQEMLFTLESKCPLIFGQLNAMTQHKFGIPLKGSSPKELHHLVRFIGDSLNP